MRKILQTTIMSIGLFSLSLLTACGGDSNLGVAGAPGANIVQNLQAAPVSNGITASGVVESTLSRNVYTALNFIVDRIYVNVGDYVEEGQVLAVLNTSDLELQIEQQRASMAQARQSGQNALRDARRRLDEAQSNLSAGTNIQIVNAQAALNTAIAALQTVQRNYDEAQRDYAEGTNPQVFSAAIALRTARVEFERLEREHANISTLHGAGIIASDELRRSENALTHARNQYNDANASYINAREAEQRTLEQLRDALQTSIAARDSAEAVLAATHTAAEQEIENLRSQVSTAEVSANLENMEAALKQLERQLRDAIIISPINGTVTSVTSYEGVRASGIMFVVEDTDNLKVTTGFREYDIAGLSPGMEVSITSDGAGGAVYSGVISRISPAAIPNSPVVMFETDIAVTSEDTSLRIGMNTRVNITLD